MFVVCVMFGWISCMGFIWLSVSSMLIVLFFILMWWICCLLLVSVIWCCGCCLIWLRCSWKIVMCCVCLVIGCCRLRCWYWLCWCFVMCW